MLVVTEAGSTLTFEDDVSRPGAWQGDLVFADGFATGPSAGAVAFGGGDVDFDASWLPTLHGRAQSAAWVADRPPEAGAAPGTIKGPATDCRCRRRAR